MPKQDPSKQYADWLEQVVTADGLVDYEAAKKNRKPLDRYVAWIARPQFSTVKKAKGRQANALNAINALTIFQVLERDLPSSVLDVGWLPGAGSTFYQGTQFQVGQEWVSLSELTDERLRWMDMDLLVHAGVNWGQASGPPVYAGLYKPRKLRDQLKGQMRRWFEDERRGVRFDGDEVLFNQHFEAYARDVEFFTNGRSLCSVAAEFTDNDTRKRLEALDRQGCPHRFAPYNAGLNIANSLD